MHSKNIENALLALTLTLTTSMGCVTSYASAPPLSFAEIPYRSLDDKAWPVSTVALPGIGARYGLARDPELAYVELNPGAEQTLVFIHGLGSYLKFWRYQLDSFASEGYRVLAIDMLGYGKSDKPASFPYTMESMAEVVRELVLNRGAANPILIGHSMGGQTALSYAIGYPGELTALILTSPAGFEEFSKREIAWFKSAFTVGLVKASTEDVIWGNIRRNNFYRWRPELEWLIEERVRVAQSPDFDQYAYANVKSVHALTQTDFVRNNLDKIRIPTLIVYGDQDRLIPNPFLHGGATDTIMEYGHARIEGSKIIALQGCGHTVQLDCSAEYNREVRAFLDAVPRGSRAPRAPAAPNPPDAGARAHRPWEPIGSAGR